MNKEIRHISNFLEFDVFRAESSLISSTSDYAITYDEFCQRLLNDMKVELQKLKEIQIEELESTNVDMDIKSICITSTIPFYDDSSMNINILFRSDVVLEETDEKFKNRKKEARLSARRNKEKTERAEYERLHKNMGLKIGANYASLGFSNIHETWFDFGMGLAPRFHDYFRIRVVS